MKLKTTLFGNVYQFKDVKEVLAKANELRSGDDAGGRCSGKLTGARGGKARVLSEMTVADIRNNPVIAYEDDCVTRLIQDDVNESGSTTRLKTGASARLREYVLSDETSVDDIAFTRKRADLGSGRGGSEDLLQRGPDLRREENAGDQKGQYHHRYSGHLQRPLAAKRHP